MNPEGFVNAHAPMPTLPPSARSMTHAGADAAGPTTSERCEQTMNEATRMADQATYDRAVQHFGHRHIALPTFAELAEPPRIGAAPVEGLKPWMPTPPRA